MASNLGCAGAAIGAGGAAMDGIVVSCVDTSMTLADKAVTFAVTAGSAAAAIAGEEAEAEAGTDVALVLECAFICATS